MPTTILLALLVIVSMLGSFAIHKYLRGRIVLSGVEYLVIGAIVGPLGLNLLDRELIQLLEPLLFLVLGAVGFSLGLHFRRRVRSGGSAVKAGVVAAILVVSAMTAVVFSVLFALDVLHSSRLWIALTIGAAAAASSILTIDLTAALVSADGPATRLARSFSIAGNIVAVVIAGTALAVRRTSEASNRFGLTETEWLVAAIGLGVASGVLFRFFLGKKQETADRTFLATVGVVTFASGMAAAADMSPLFLGAVAGLTVSLLSDAAETLEPTMERLERPALAVLVIFAGAMWTPFEPLLFVLPVVYLGGRFVIVRVASVLAMKVDLDLPRVERPGDALLAQGGIAIAVAVTFAQVYPNEAGVVLFTILTPALVSDIYASRPLLRFLTDAQEADGAIEEPI